MEGFTVAKPGASRWEMKRPACLAAASFLGTTALILPLYQGWMLPQQSPGKRIFCLGMLLLALLLAAALTALLCRERGRWYRRIILVLLSSGTAVLVVFGSLERVLPAVRAADSRQAALQVEVLACDVMDYGSRYLVRTVGQGALPSGLKGRVYSFEEPAADEGDRMELTARLETKMENDDRSRNIFFYAFTEEGTLRRTQKHQTVRGRMLAAADSLYDAPALGMVEGCCSASGRRSTGTLRRCWRRRGWCTSSRSRASTSACWPPFAPGFSPEGRTTSGASPGFWRCCRSGGTSPWRSLPPRRCAPG